MLLRRKYCSNDDTIPNANPSDLHDANLIRKQQRVRHFKTGMLSFEVASSLSCAACTNNIFLTQKQYFRVICGGKFRHRRLSLNDKIEIGLKTISYCHIFMSSIGLYLLALSLVPVAFLFSTLIHCYCRFWYLSLAYLGRILVWVQPL